MPKNGKASARRCLLLETGLVPLHATAATSETIPCAWTCLGGRSAAVPEDGHDAADPQVESPQNSSDRRRSNSRECEASAEDCNRATIAAAALCLSSGVDDLHAEGPAQAPSSTGAAER